MRGLGRNRGSDLFLAARPGWTRSVALRISIVSCVPDYAIAGLPEGGVGVPHGMQRHRQFSRQRNLGYPRTGSLCDRLGPAGQAGAAELPTPGLQLSFPKKSWPWPVPRSWRAVPSPAPHRSRTSFDRRVQTRRRRPQGAHVSIDGSSLDEPRTGSPAQWRSPYPSRPPAFAAASSARASAAPTGKRVLPGEVCPERQPVACRHHHMTRFLLSYAGPLLMARRHRAKDRKAEN